MFLNETGTIGVIVSYATIHITGSLFISLLLLIVTMMAFMMLLRIPIEFEAILILPTILVLMAYMSEFLLFGGLLLIYLAILITRMFFIK